MCLLKTLRKIKQESNLWMSFNVNQVLHVSVMQKLSNTLTGSHSFFLPPFYFHQLNKLPTLSTTKPDNIFHSSFQTTHNDPGQVQVVTVQRIKIIWAAETLRNDWRLKWRTKGIMCRSVWHHGFKAQMHIARINIKFHSYEGLSGEIMLTV